MGYFVEVRMAILPDHLPHTFLVVTDSDGVSRAWGFAPEKTGFWGMGPLHEMTITAGKAQPANSKYQSNRTKNLRL